MKIELAKSFWRPPPRCVICRAVVEEGAECATCGPVRETSRALDDASWVVTSHARAGDGYRGPGDTVDLYRHEGRLVARRVGDELELDGLTLALGAWDALAEERQGTPPETRWVVAGRRGDGDWEVLHVSSGDEPSLVIAHAARAIGRTIERTTLPPLEGHSRARTHRCGRCPAENPLPVGFVSGTVACTSCGARTTFEGARIELDDAPPDSTIQTSTEVPWRSLVVFAVLQTLASLFVGRWFARDGSDPEDAVALLFVLGSAAVLVHALYGFLVEPRDPLVRIRAADTGVRSAVVLAAIVAASVSVGVAASWGAIASMLLVAGVAVARLAVTPGVRTLHVTPDGVLDVDRLRQRVGLVEVTRRALERDHLGGEVRAPARWDLTLHVVDGTEHVFGPFTSEGEARGIARAVLRTLGGKRPKLRTWRELEADAHAVRWTVTPGLANPVDHASAIEEEEVEEAEREERARRSR